MKDNKRPRVLIVGAGIGGAAAFKHLQDSGQVSLTVVDRKDYFEVPYAQLRGLVDPVVGVSSRWRYADWYGAAFVRGNVVGVDDHSAHLAGGETIPFDFLILAPGGRYPSFPYLKGGGTETLEARNVANESATQSLRLAKGFWVAGGGVVGVELAGELASAFPGVPVKLVHRGPRLMENLKPQASAIAQAQLEELGVEVQLGSSTAVPVEGERVFWSTSPEPATEFLPSDLLGHGQILVDQQLRVRGHAHWYALGDAAETGDAKHGALAGQQAAYVASHLLASISGRATKPYRGGPAIALVPIGRRKGFVQAPFGVVTWKWMVNVKRKDFFVTMMRKALSPSPIRAKGS